MDPRAHRRAPAAAAVAIALAALLAGCASAEGGATPSPGVTSPSPGSTASATASPDPSPTSTGEAVVLPTDCRAILNESVLAELGATPLNDPAFGPSGVQADGTLVCIWADPRADTTRLTTTISGVNRGPALDLLNQLADAEGFTCFTPDGGTRCEKTWPNPTYPVTDGRTLFWRDDILIDTQYSNLAPAGYTAAIVASLFAD